MLFQFLLKNIKKKFAQYKYFIYLCAIKIIEMIKTLVDDRESSILSKLNNLKITKEDIIQVLFFEGEIHVWYDDGKN